MLVTTVLGRVAYYLLSLVIGRDGTVFGITRHHVWQFTGKDYAQTKLADVTHGVLHDIAVCADNSLVVVGEGIASVSGHTSISAPWSITAAPDTVFLTGDSPYQSDTDGINPGLAACPDGSVLLLAHHTVVCLRDGIATTVAGSGRPGNADGIGRAATLNCPTSIAVDVAGHAVVGERGAIRKIELATGTVVTVGTGFGRSYVSALGIDPAGDVIFFNPVNSSLCRISGAGLGPGFFAAGFPPRWEPGLPVAAWAKEAVHTVLLIAQRARSPSAAVVSLAPLLPLALWHHIIGLVPVKSLGIL
jgi:hypothetical protein